MGNCITLLKTLGCHPHLTPTENPPGAVGLTVKTDQQSLRRAPAQYLDDLGTRLSQEFLPIERAQQAPARGLPLPHWALQTTPSARKVLQGQAGPGCSPFTAPPGPVPFWVKATGQAAPSVTHTHPRLSSCCRSTADPPAWPPRLTLHVGCGFAVCPLLMLPAPGGDPVGPVHGRGPGLEGHSVVTAGRCQGQTRTRRQGHQLPWPWADTREAQGGAGGAPGPV